MILANAAPIGTGNYMARDNVRDNFMGVGASKVDIIDIKMMEIRNFVPRFLGIFTFFGASYRCICIRGIKSKSTFFNIFHGDILYVDIAYFSSSSGITLYTNSVI